MPSKSSPSPVQNPLTFLIVVVLKVTTVNLRHFPPQILILYFIWIMCVFTHHHRVVYVSCIVFMLHMFHTLSWYTCLSLSLSCNIYFTPDYLATYVFTSLLSCYRVFLSCHPYHHQVIYWFFVKVLHIRPYNNSCHHHPITWSLVQTKIVNETKTRCIPHYFSCSFVSGGA